LPLASPVALNCGPMRRHLDWLIPVLVLIGALALQVQDGPVVAELRNKVFDTYQRLKPRAYDPGVPVRILAIDEESLGRLGQWPWSRAVLARIVRRSDDPWTVCALSLVLGGALGNLCDRVFRAPGFLRGEVVDFVRLGWFPTFNAADSAITIGAILLVLFGWRAPRERVDGDAR